MDFKKPKCCRNTYNVHFHEVRREHLSKYVEKTGRMPDDVKREKLLCVPKVVSTLIESGVRHNDVERENR